MSIGEDNRTTDKSYDSNSFQPANIMIAGITGTGKSTLINAIFGFEGDKGAKTGTGKPITAQIDEYKDPDIPIRIWDTVGLELNGEKTRASIAAIRKTIGDKTHSGNNLDVIHAIWYCIDSGSSRYQDAEMEFIRELYSFGIPFIIVLTKCINLPEEIELLEKEIKNENKKNGMGQIEVIQVLAKDYNTRLGTVEAFGLEELVNTTLDRLPEFLKNSFAAAQRVDKLQKRERSEEIIFDVVEETKKDFSTNVPIVRYFTTNDKTMKMLKNIGKMYNLIISEEDLERIVTSIDLPNALDGFWNPFYMKKVNEMLEKKRDLKFKADPRFGFWDKSAQMVAFFGYNFIDTLEEMWDDYTEKQIRRINEDMVRIIRDEMNERLGKYKMYPPGWRPRN